MTDVRLDQCLCECSEATILVADKAISSNGWQIGLVIGIIIAVIAGLVIGYKHKFDSWDRE